MTDNKKNYLYDKQLKYSIEDGASSGEPKKPRYQSGNKNNKRRNDQRGKTGSGYSGERTESQNKSFEKKDKRFDKKAPFKKKTSDENVKKRPQEFSRDSGYKEKKSADAQKSFSGKNNFKSRKPKEHDGFDDIRSYSGRYVPVDNSAFDDDLPYESFYADEPIERRNTRGQGSDSPLPGMVAGRNAVRELLKSNRSIDKIYVKAGDREGSIVVLVAEAVSRGVPIVEVDASKLDSMCGGANHQGIIAAAAEKEYTDVDSILEIARSRGEKPLIVIADGIEDPHNLGAIIRSAECAGAHGLIIPKRRAVGLTPTVTKASAGAIEHLAIAKVNNIAQTIDKLKKNGVWIFAAEAGGDAYYDVDFDVPCAIIMGSEGDGVSKLIKERSDFIVSIPMYGSVNSLNVSTAAAVLLCHAARVHHSGK